MNTKYCLPLLTFIIVFTINFSVSANNADGMIRVQSNNSVETTIDKLKKTLTNKGMTIFKRVSHSHGAAKVGLKLRETELLIFGNPKIGTQLMLCEQSAALDLPMKALAYKDELGQVWLAYNAPDYIAKRHHIKKCQEVTSKMRNALANFVKVATQ